MYYYCPSCETYLRYDWSLRHLWDYDTQPCAACKSGVSERVLPPSVATADAQVTTQDVVKAKPRKRKKKGGATSGAASAAAGGGSDSSPSLKAATPSTSPASSPRPVVPLPPSRAAASSSSAAAADDDDGFVQVSREKKVVLAAAPQRITHIDQQAWEAIKVVYEAQAFHVNNIRQCYPKPGTDRAVYCYTAVKPNKNIRPYLEQMYKDQVTGVHGNYGTTFHNRGAPLPASLGRDGASAYREYGFGTVSIGDGERWFRLNGAEEIQDHAATQSIGAILRNATPGGFDLGDRIIVDLRSLRVYYTPDHYTTFYQHEAGTKNWRIV